MTNKKSPDPNQDFSAIPIITSDEIRSDSKKLIDDYCNLFEKNPNDGMASLIEDVCVHTTILAQLQQAIFVKNGQLQKVIDNQQKVIQKLEDAAKIRTSQISKRLEKLEDYKARGM
tara:strand:+ start:202 stop:549 length:348 start_codon:yes stop_codon:yes gene_type:complete